MKFKLPVFCGLFFLSVVTATFAERGSFDLDRWEKVMQDIRTKATAENIDKSVIDETLKSPVFIPGIVKSDRNQSEFKLTLEQYLNRTVSDTSLNN